MKTGTIRLVGAGLTLALSVALAGCGGDDSAAPASGTTGSASIAGGTPEPGATQPDGWKSFASPEHNISFGAPDNWAEIDLSLGPEELESGLADLGLENREAVTAMVRQLGAANLDYYFLIDTESVPAAGAPFVTNLNVVCASAPGVDSVGQLENAIRIGNTQLGAEDIRTEPTTLGGREAIRVTYVLPTPTVRIAGEQYTWLDDADRICSLTLSTDRPNDYEGLLQEIAATVKYG